MYAQKKKRCVCSPSNRLPNISIIAMETAKRDLLLDPGRATSFHGSVYDLEISN